MTSLNTTITVPTWLQLFLSLITISFIYLPINYPSHSIPCVIIIVVTIVIILPVVGETLSLVPLSLIVVLMIALVLVLLLLLVLVPLWIILVFLIIRESQSLAGSLPRVPAWLDHQLLEPVTHEQSPWMGHGAGIYHFIVQGKLLNVGSRGFRQLGQLSLDLQGLQLSLGWGFKLMLLLRVGGGGAGGSSRLS